MIYNTSCPLPPASCLSTPSKLYFFSKPYLAQAGFTQANPEDLLTAIRQLIVNNEAVEEAITEIY